MVSLICLAIVLFISFRVSFLKKDIFSPVHLFFLSESTTLGIAYLKYDDAMTDFRPLTWIVILGTAFCFWLGAMIVKFLGEKVYGKYNQPHFPIAELQETLKGYKWSWHILSALLILVPMSFFYYLISLQYGGVPLLNGRMYEVMAISGLTFGIFNIFPVSGPLPLFLYLLGSFKKVNPHRSLRILCIVLFWVTMISTNLFFLSRGSSAYVLIFGVLMWHYFRKPFGSRHILYGLLTGLLIFSSMALLRQQYLSHSTENKQNRFIHLPYSYISNNYWNLDHALHPDNDIPSVATKYGIGFLEGPLNFTPFGYKLAQGLGWDSIFNESIMKVKGLNTVTFHFPLYNELGFFSLFTIAFAFGMLVSFLYMRMKTRTSMYYLVLYFCFAYMMAISHHDEFYQISTFSFWPAYLFITVGICYPFRRKQTHLNEKQKENQLEPSA